MGHDYLVFIAYYLASPLNLLTVVVPFDWLREAVTIILLIKIGCAGLFTAVFLRYVYKQNIPPTEAAGTAWPLALPVFSSFYALCVFTLAICRLLSLCRRLDRVSHNSSMACPEKRLQCTNFILCPCNVSLHQLL